MHEFVDDKNIQLQSAQLRAMQQMRFLDFSKPAS